MACAYSVVTRGAASVLGTNFCTWCLTTKPNSAQVTTRIPLHAIDTIQSIGLQWHMSDALILVSVFYVFGVLVCPLVLYVVFFHHMSYLY